MNYEVWAKCWISHSIGNFPNNNSWLLSFSMKMQTQRDICEKLIDLIVTRPLIACLSLYTTLKPICNKKIGIMGLVYIFNQWAFIYRARGPRQRCREPQSNGGGGANFENLPTRIGVRIWRARCEWWQLGAAQKGDRNYLPIRANVFFMSVKNLQTFGFSIFQYFWLQFAPNEDTNLFLRIFWGKKILSNKINFSQKVKKHWI